MFKPQLRALFFAQSVLVAYLNLQALFFLTQSYSDQTGFPVIVLSYDHADLLLKKTCREIPYTCA